MDYEKDKRKEPIAKLLFCFSAIGNPCLYRKIQDDCQDHCRKNEIQRPCKFFDVALEEDYQNDYR